MVRRILLRIGDFIFVTRPLILIPVWSFYILGSRAGEQSLARGDAGAGYDVAGFVCLTAIMITAYLINQVFDQDTDRRNNKGHFLTRGILGVRTVVAMALVSFAVASVTYQDTAPAQRLPLVAALVLSLVYSLPPIRLCARPFLDLAANAAGYGGIAFASGFLAHDPSGSAAAVRALPWVFLVGATFLHTTILDRGGDAATGKITTAVATGERPASVIALVLALSGPAAAWLEGSTVAIALTLASLPLFAAGAAAHLLGWNSRARVSSYVVQAATLFVAVAAAAAEPRYLALVVPIVAVSRPYYRARFGVGYPGVADANGS